MRTTLIAMSAALALAVGSDAFAGRGGGGGGGHGGGGRGGGSHGGGGHYGGGHYGGGHSGGKHSYGHSGGHHHHGGHYGWYGAAYYGAYWGWGWGWPWYGAYYPYYGYPAYYDVAPVTYGEIVPSAPPTVWYYCTEPAGYYPYVQRCNVPWMTVEPQAQAMR